MSGRTVLVAGVGNIFLGDDGFGVEVARRLAELPLPPHVELVDSGVRGVHLAYQMLDGYHTVVLVDAVPLNAAPGTVRLIDTGGTGPEAPRPVQGRPVVDGHHMTPDSVLALLDHLSAGTGGARPARVLVLGCEPESLEEGIGLSAAVAAAVDEAVALLLRLLGEESEQTTHQTARPA